MEGLKSCPFCGCEDIELYQMNDLLSSSWSIGCTKCDVEFDRESKEEAISVWNNRRE